jgi:hypothetical protein
MHEGSRIQTHFVAASFAAGWTKGEPRLSDAVDAVYWGSGRGLALPATPEPSEILGSAARIERWRREGVELAPAFGHRRHPRAARHARPTRQREQLG